MYVVYVVPRMTTQVITGGESYQPHQHNDSQVSGILQDERKLYLYVKRRNKSIDMREPQKVTFMRIADGSFMARETSDVEASEGVYQVLKSKMKQRV